MHNISKKIAFVIPWYGKDIPGGAEAECRRTAENLAKRDLKVEILTTCIHKHDSDWGINYHPEGITIENGVKVRRFRVDQRRGEIFNLLNAKILKGGILSESEEKIFLQNMVNSRHLYNFIRDNAKSYIFFFIPYLFSTTYYGARISPKNSHLIACLHDEGYARFKHFKRLYPRLAGIIFHTKSEMELGRSLYDLDEERCYLLGEGVDTDFTKNPDRFRKKYSISEPFILYAGRKAQGKNVDILIDFYKKYRERHPDTPLKLVLLGGGELPGAYRDVEGMIDLGFLPVQDKYDAMAAANIFCLPSDKESFSIVIMEAWLCDTPILVNGNCAVTKEHVIRSNGGLYFSNYPEFEESVNTLLNNQVLAKKLAKAGRNYVLANYTWDKICESYIELIKKAEKNFYTPLIKKVALYVPPPPKVPPNTDIIKDSKLIFPKKTIKNKIRAIHQILPNFSYGDAIGNNVLFLRDCFRAMGYSSNIYAQYMHPKVEKEGIYYTEYRKVASPENVLIFHFSIGSAISDFFRALPDKKVIIYHNITPHHYSKGINPNVEHRCRMGREELRRLASVVDYALADSSFNAQELKEMGFPPPYVLPLSVKLDFYREVKFEFQDENYINILHVSRIAPNKKIEDLIKVFYLVKKYHIQNSRLFLVGTDESMEVYSHAVQRLVEDLELEDVYFTGHVTFAELTGYYQNSHIYLCMSEHEGFCVPLLESMYFNLPILAYGAGAIPETLGNAGIIVKEKDYLLISELLKELIINENLRNQIIWGQKQRLYTFLPQNVVPYVWKFVERLEEDM